MYSSVAVSVADPDPLFLGHPDLVHTKPDPIKMGPITNNLYRRLI